MKKVFSVLLIVLCLVLSANVGFAKKSKATPETRADYVNLIWWERFDDPILYEYIQKALDNNHNLKITSLKTLEAKQAVKTQLGYELPTLSFLGTYARVKVPSIDIDNIQLDSMGLNFWALPLIASYEADIFLKNRDKTRSVKKQSEMAAYQEKASCISTVSAVATAYFNVIQLDETIRLQKDLVGIRKKIYELTNERNKAGLASTFDVVQTDKAHTAAAIMLNELEKNRVIALDQLAVLTGETPNNIQDLKRTPLSKIEFKGVIPDVISSDVLLKRPDMMNAEAALEKAKIDVRIARKEFLPRIPIVGAVGYAATSLSSLFDWRSTFGVIGAGLAQDIFLGGRKISNLKIKKLRYEQLFETYKNTDIAAIQDTNDSLAKVKYDTQKDVDNKKKLQLEKNNFKLVEYRYHHGVISYLDLIQYKENLLSAEKDVISSKTQRLVSYLSLYKATGANL